MRNVEAMRALVAELRAEEANDSRGRRSQGHRGAAQEAAADGAGADCAAAGPNDNGAETELFELGLHAAHGMYEEWGGAPAAGVVTGLGRVAGRLFMVIANDATVKAGAFFPMTAKKVIRAQTIAMENSLPTIYLVDSAGVFLPLQEDVFPDQDDFGRVFRNNAVMSARGIPQITAIMGMCVAGGAYLPVMCDHVLMTEGSGLFLAGPALVQAAIGQKMSAEELGGARMHAEISGTVDFHEPNDEACMARVRSLVEKMGARPEAPFDRAEAVAPRYEAEEIYGIFDGVLGNDAARQYDMREIIARVVDDSRFDEYKKGYGETLLCGYARIDGHAVGIVANQKLHATQIDAKGDKRTEFGGVIYKESAEKAARFIMDCNQGRIPLVFLHDVNGFMVGRDAEWSGIIRAGTKMVNAVAELGGAEDHGDRGRLVWRGTLCDVRQGVRSAICVCLAHGALHGDERRGGGRHAGGDQGEADGARGQDGGRGGAQGAVRFDLRHVHGADEAAVWSGAAVDRQDHRPGTDARGAGMGAGGGAVQSGGGEIQRGDFADVGALNRYEKTKARARFPGQKSL